MKHLLKPVILLLFLSCLGFASTNDLFFLNHADSSKNCLFSKQSLRDCFLADGTSQFPSIQHSIRMRVINPGTDTTSRFGIYIERPFFIIDGIHLSTDEARSLDDFYDETEQYNIPEIVSTMGYTPILVQFSQTVYTSLATNATAFKDLLRYLNNNKVISLPGKNEDGMIILGISQGGILGRYGAYLYDTTRKKTDAPIRLFISLDSPHQGAVMPRGLISTLEFWKNQSDEAEAFYDLITAPGAQDLLIYDTAPDKSQAINTSSKRFLFKDYRNAANYKGFPAVLIAQGQLKGNTPVFNSKYFELNRYAKKAGLVIGRAEASMGYSNNETTEYSSNRVYKRIVSDNKKTAKGKTSLDFIQGSTYPFAKTMYKSLHDGFLDALPNGMKQDLILGLSVKLSTGWEKDSLYQASSTFIPTASAMDLQCDGDLAIRKDCAYTVNSNGFPFEAPGNRSTAKAVYAVDPTHPRYSEAISGRHIEGAKRSDGSINTQALLGMQTDIWRTLCEVARADYDSTRKEYRNPKLKGFFHPQTSCMDQSQMPDIIKNGGIAQTTSFGYIRYDYNQKATENDESVSFNLPAGWQKTVMANNGDEILGGSTFEIEVKVENPKSNWMKAELLLTPFKNGGGQIQLSEIDVPQDGEFHTLRWQMPQASGKISNFRWFRVILNSNGAKITVKKPRLILNTRTAEALPPAITDNTFFPTNTYKIVPWDSTVRYSKTTYQKQPVLSIQFNSLYSGLHFDFGTMRSMNAYRELQVGYISGTCQNSALYFDSKSGTGAKLSNGELQNGIVYKILPLSQIIDTRVTPNASLSASRLSVMSLSRNETCIISSIRLK